MKGLLFLILTLFFFSPAQAVESGGVPQTSLFLSPQEAYEASLLAQKIPPERHGDIHLGAVMYYGPDDWTLWLQDKKWTPDTVSDDLRVLEVTSDEVRLAWRGKDAASEIEFVLKPNQSFQTATGIIISEP